MLDAGTRLGPFEVLGTLGAGGMGEVYRARDTRLGRDVALKILPATFANDVDRLNRFEREAQVLASLNHPHIAAIYGLEDSDTGRALVLELVEGETLADRLARGPMPIDEALPVARQIAEALEAAHEHGIVHRDLKPANIKLTPGGRVKVLDFGLAKLIGPADRSGSSSSMDQANSPTITSPATMHGVILGTAPYMSPEQARGRAVDRSTDVWAFGCVLYEMLTGRRAFDGSDVTETIVAIIGKEPVWEALPADTPASVRRLLRRCLEKDAGHRAAHLSVARLELDDASRGGGELSAVAVPPARARWLGIAAVAGAVTFALGWVVASGATRFGTPATDVAPSFTNIIAPPDVLSAFHDGFALSPDGKTLAFSARDAKGTRMIWTRRIDQLSAQRVSGTEGGRTPFWSPDSRHLAFFADEKLRRVPVNGGQPQIICDAAGLFPDGSWSVHDQILFTQEALPLGSIRVVPASGGTPRVLDHVGPASRATWLPDGRHFLYARPVSEGWELRTASLNDDDTSLVMTLAPRDAPFAYVSPGHLLFNQNDALVAIRFDPATARVVGSAVPVAGYAGSPKSWFAVSGAANRLVAFVSNTMADAGSPGDPLARMQWVTRDGDITGSLGPTGRYWTMRLSPDGRRAAVSMGTDVWILEANGHRARLTSGRENYSPAWSGDGSEVMFIQSGNVVRQRVDASTPATTVAPSYQLPTDWSRDGRWLLVEVETGIHLRDLRGGTTRPWRATSFEEGQGRFSPDGRWIAYMSNASGRREVYVAPTEGSGAPVAVSTGGGAHAAWRGDGRELFYIAGDGSMMAVDVNLGAGTSVIGRPKTLFRIPLNDIASDWFAPYDVTPDGQRFLLNVPDRPEPLMLLDGLNAIVK